MSSEHKSQFFLGHPVNLDYIAVADLVVPVACPHDPPEMCRDDLLLELLDPRLGADSLYQAQQQVVSKRKYFN